MRNLSLGSARSSVRGLGGAVLAALLLSPIGIRAADGAAPASPAEFLPGNVVLYLHVGPWKEWSKGCAQTSFCKLCEEPEVKAFLAGPLGQLQHFLYGKAGGEPPALPGPTVLAQVFTKLDEVMPGPLVVALRHTEEDALAKRPPSVALIVGAPDMDQNVQRLLTQALKRLLPEDWANLAKAVIGLVSDKGFTIETYKETDLRILSAARYSFTLALYRKHLILASDKDFCKEIVDGLSGLLPKKLADQAEFKACGLSGQEHLGTYLDLPGLRRALGAVKNPGKPMPLLDWAGLSDLRAIAWSLRMNGPAFESRTALLAGEKRQGVLDVLDASPLSAEALRVCRAGCTFAAGARIQEGNLLPVLKGLLKTSLGEAGVRRLEAVDKKLAVEGRDLRKELAEAFGNEFVLTDYDGKDAPVGALSTWVASLSIKDPARAEKLMLDLLKRVVAERSPAEKFEEVFVEQDFDGAKIRYLKPSRGATGLEPIVALAGKRVLITQDMLTAKAALKSLKEVGLRESEAFRAALQGTNGGRMGSLFLYGDWGRGYTAFFDVVAKVLKFAAALDLMRGLGVDVNMLPTPEAVTKHLFPALAVVQVQEKGIVLTSRSPLPSVEVLAPPAAALAAVLASFGSGAPAAAAEPEKRPPEPETKK